MIEKMKQRFSQLKPYLPMDVFLTLILTLSWFVGLFPAKNPCDTTKNFKFRWNSIITFYSTFLLAFLFVIHLDYAIGVLNSTSGVVSGSSDSKLSNAKFILSVCLAVAEAVFVILLRLAGITRCYQTVRLIKGMKSVQEFSAKNKKCDDNNNPGFLGVRQPRGIVIKLAFYAPLVVTYFLNATAILNFIKLFITNPNSAGFTNNFFSGSGDQLGLRRSGIFSNFPNSTEEDEDIPDFIVRFTGVTVNVNTFITSVISNALIVCLGVNLLNTHKSFFASYIQLVVKSKSIPKSKLKAKSKSQSKLIDLDLNTKNIEISSIIHPSTVSELHCDKGENERRILLDYAAKFHELQKCFKDYDQIAGTQALFNIMFLCFTVLYTIHTLIWSKNEFMDVSHLGCSIINFAFILSIGNTLQFQVESVGNKLGRYFLNEKLAASGLPGSTTNSVMFLITESMMQWQWKFTARNILIVNNALLPPVVGAMVTFITFIVQLELSESNNLWLKKVMEFTSSNTSDFAKMLSQICNTSHVPGSPKFDY